MAEEQPPPPPPDVTEEVSGSEEDSEEDEKGVQNLISQERTNDLYWLKPPMDRIRITDEREHQRRWNLARRAADIEFQKGLITREQWEVRVKKVKFNPFKYQSRMKIVLRDLAPDSVFDPREAWDREKEARILAEEEAAEASKAAAAAAAAATKKGKKANKAPKLSKADEIRLKNEQAQKKAQHDSDKEKLDNAAKDVKRGSIQSLENARVATPHGKLRKFLMVLEQSYKSENLPSTFDVLWAIEQNPLFQEAEEEYEAVKKSVAEEDDSDKKDKKKKDKKDKKSDKKEKKSDKIDKKLLSPEAQLINEFRKELKKARDARMSHDMVKFQMEEMHDLLPPLSPYHRVFKLDDWQCRVLELVDQDKSAIVCAPTSSGKTVISTYVSVKVARDAKLAAAANPKSDVKKGGVLFVVPSEPLVWQVAAMFEKLLPGQVALITNLMQSRPEGTKEQSNILVGTPTAIESGLSKVRGKVGAELRGKLDWSAVVGGFNFSYVVFDEVHCLDSEEGDALQRLIRLVECPFLALSATIGNPDDLKNWWQSVRSTHIDVVSGTPAPQGGLVKRSPDVHLEIHEGRFINIQRLVWSMDKLTPLHPCAAVTIQGLRTTSLKSLSLSMTPRDVYALWEAIDKHIVDKNLINSASPFEFFGAFGDPQRTQITLERAKEYENTLKEKLQELAFNEAIETQVQAVLDEFSASGLQAEENPSLMDFAFACKESNLFPCLCFQLDTFKCVQQFKELIRALEQGQRKEFPEYYEELQAKKEEQARQREAEMRAVAASGKKKNKDDDTDIKSEREDLAKDADDMFIDTEAPHPKYVLSSPKAYISSVEFDDIIKEMRTDKADLPKHHPLMRGLRRGIGLYIDDVASSVYRRIVQKLAQKGKLALVFSDHSLAYGVNMPFRTCAFSGSMSGLLTPLMAQQMSGRAGRRGLDTQGNLVYLGMGWEQISDLIVGKIPDIKGEPHHYPTMVLQEALSTFVDPRQMANVCRPSLSCSARGSDEEDGYYAVSSQLLQELGMLTASNKPPSAARKTALNTVWELREHVADSLALEFCFDKFLDEFVHNKPDEYAEKEPVQLAFFCRFVQIFDRQPPRPGTLPLHEHQYNRRETERQQLWNDWENHLGESQARFDRLSEGLRSELETRGMRQQILLKVPPGEPIDSAVFQIFIEKRVDPTLSSIEKFRVVHRLLTVGHALRIIHNCLAQPGAYQKLELVLRKCFNLVKYILTDVVEAETVEADPAMASAAEDIANLNLK